MMKRAFRFLFAGAFMLLALVSCSEKEEQDNGDGNENKYAAPEITVETAEWNAPAKGTLTAEIAINATADWTAESADSWLTVEKAGAGISLTATENNGTEERSTKVTLSCTDGIRTTYEYIAVTQDGLAYITVGKARVTLVGDEDSVTVTVESNYSWSCGECDDWLTVSRDGDVLTVSADTNNGKLRTGAATLTAGDGAENVMEAKVTVYQAGTTDMVLTYSITSSNTSTWLLLSGNVNCTVCWGDNSAPETITYAQPAHTYATAGEYDIIISGTVTSLTSDGISSETNPLPLTSVRQWGNTGLTNMKNAFRYCGNLESLPGNTGDAFANVTSFRNSCACCYKLKEIPSKLFANCTEATDLGWCFYDCTSLKTIAADAFNCPKVTDMSYLFYSCTSLVEIPAGLFDCCPEVTDFEAVFCDVSSLKTIPTELFANCLKVENFSYVFSYCPSLTTIPDGLFADCPEAISFEATFYGCPFLETIPKDLFGNCPKATNFAALFYYDTKITEIPAELFKGCPEANDFQFAFYSTGITSVPEGLFEKNTKVENFYSVFYNCSAITEIPASLFANCSEVTDFSYIFRGCTGITSIPEELFANCPEATNFQTAFYLCSITGIPTGLFSNNRKVTNFKYTFSTCVKIAGGESPYDEIDGVKVHLYERSSHTDIYAVPTDYMFCFELCTGLSDYSSIPSDWTDGPSPPGGYVPSSVAASVTETSFAPPKFTLESTIM